jgi:hypothetical protein
MRSLSFHGNSHIDGELAMSARLFRRCLFVILVACAMVGCQQQPPPPVSFGPTSVDYSNKPDTESPTGEPLSPESIFPTDPTATRLQDIGGYILLYYRDHKQLPASLDDLRSLPGGDDLQFTSASTGEFFAYQPAGMWSPNHTDKCILIYDPNLINGKRWCLFMTAPNNGAALSVNVTAIPDSMFQTYRPDQQ